MNSAKSTSMALAILLMVIFPISPSASRAAPIYAVNIIVVVFHHSACQKLPISISSYLSRIRNKGYQVFELCTEPVTVEEMREKISASLLKKGIHIKQVSGINLFGPVIRTGVALTCESRTSGKALLELKPASSALAFDHLNFSYEMNGRLLTDVSSGWHQPYPNRWVSHLATLSRVQNPTPTDIVKAIRGSLNTRVDESVFSAPGTASHGEARKLRLEYLLYYVHAQRDYLPGTIAQNINTLKLVPVILFPLTGLDRWRAGYSFFNRYQTKGDIPGSTFMFIFYAYTLLPDSFMSLMTQTIVMAESVKNRLHPFPDNNCSWKKLIMSGTLADDGLMKYPD